MIKVKRLLTIVLCSVALVGCVTPSIYHFGNYSQTLYTYEKNPSEETQAAHKQELEDIITKSATKKLVVPPGIYAELGYLNLKENSCDEAVRLFQIEAETYPESAQLMARLINRAQQIDLPKSE